VTAPGPGSASRGPDPGPRTAWSAAFGHRPFNLFQAARLLASFATQMQSVAVGWQVYAMTGRAIDLAWVGLAQFFPPLLLSLYAGHVADRVERRRILMICQACGASLSLALLTIARTHGTGTAPIYAVLVGIGVVRAFQGPANQSLLPLLVPVDVFPNAVTWNSSFWQASMIVGPSLGGILYGAGGPALVYAAAAACFLGATILLALMPTLAPRTRAEPPTRASLFAGVRYVWDNPMVLGAISLDLFAVLLGGATALLPIFARDVLQLGPWALGALRSAPAVGAALTGILLALRPIERGAGAKMLACVAVFGVGTVVFGLSRSFPLSLAALAIVGASDMVSVVVRSSLVQLATPDSMRGRVSAVNMVFIGASNELGEFESGLTAQWFGAVPSVVLGGIGTLVVVAIWVWRFPALRKVDSLVDRLPSSAAPH
jgi:MFS family permease